jgi:23S rRNA (cytosine1962-C5)-methyltransferase
MHKDLEYKLLDTGNRRKLESYNGYIIDRPDPQALWPKTNQDLWDKADAVFKEEKGDKREERGSWKIYKNIPDDFSINFFKELRCSVKLTPFKHTGIFPEQYSNWDFIDKLIIKAKKKNKDKPIKVLNLFGYTGCATIVASNAGAEVTHVDASKSSIAGGMLNAKLSGIENNPIRWMLDDAFTFVKKEIRRGNKYDGIIMDPPSFGRGSAGQVWKIEDNLIDFLDETVKLLNDQPLFFIVNGYANGYSHIAYKNNLEHIFKTKEGIESFELLIEGQNGTSLPSGIVARKSF